MKSALFASCATTVLMSLPGQAFAQPSDDIESRQIERITVTAQKREQTLEDVPISIKAYTAEDIDKLQIENVSDIALLTPSVALNDGLNPNFTSITIRGIGNIGGEQATSGIYLDGFELSANSSAGLGVQYDDIERIEVLRGPQGTTFGRNVIAGAISITTKDVGDEFSGFGEVNVENFGGVGVRGAVDLPIAPGVFGARVAGYYDHSNGNIENVGSAGGRNDFDRFGGRLTTDTQFTDRLTLKTTVSYDKLDQGLQNFIGDGFLDPTLLPLVDIINAGLNPFLPPGSLPTGPDALFPDQNDTVEFNSPTSFDFETFIATARFDYDFDNMSLVWVSGYVDNSSNRLEDTDLSEIDAVILSQQNQSEFASTELRLQSTGDTRLDWTIGLYAAVAEFTTESSIVSGSEVGNVYFLPGGVPLPIGPGGAPAVLPFDVSIFPNNLELFSTNATSNENFYAAFAEFEYDLLDNLSIFAGARFNRDETDEETFDPVTLVSLNALLSPNFTETAPLPPVFAASQGTPLGEVILWPAAFPTAQEDAAFERVTWRAGVKWAPTDAINLYGTVSTGYRPGGVQLAGGLVPPTFGSETLTNYEIGAKSFLFDGIASVNLALFYMDWRNVQISTIAPGATFGFTDNVGEAEVLGVEFDLLAQPADGLTIGFGFAYLDTEVKSFIDSDGFDRSGFRLPNSAAFSSNAFIEYQRPIIGEVEGFIRATLIHTGEQEPDFITGGIDRPPLEAWQRVDLRAGVSVEDNWRIEFYAENLLDEIYATGKDSVGFGFAGQYVVSPPRRLGGRITKQF